MAEKKKSFLESIADMGSQILTPKPVKPKPYPHEEDDKESQLDKLSKSTKKAFDRD